MTKKDKKRILDLNKEICKCEKCAGTVEREKMCKKCLKKDNEIEKLYESRKRTKT
jgi:hypothetical protein